MKTTFLPARATLLASLLLGLFFFSSCDKDDDDNLSDQYDKIKPTGPRPAWGPSITPQMLAVIESLDSLGARPIYTLTTEQARMQPTAADAAMAVINKFNIPVPAPTVDTMGYNIPVSGGSIHARVYTPRTGKATYPVIVYYHGGGWVIATIDTYNTSAQALAEKADAIVVSVEYRKGPEFKFPTAHNDAFQSYKWVLKNASTMKGDSTRVAVAGESAGGNLAVAVSMMARDSAVRKPVHAVAVYPVASNDPATPSKIQYVTASPLSTPDLPWFLTRYLVNESQSANPWISLVKGNLSGLPETTIIGAELDPLQSEGKQLADLMKAAGVDVSYRLYTGVTHEFFGMGLILREAHDAQDFAADELRDAFN